MRIFVRIVAVLLIGMGVVWILQGVNILPGSFMTGQIQWAYRGAASAIVGLLLFAFFGRSPSRSR
jgi:hypothetical protein